MYHRHIIILYHRHKHYTTVHIIILYNRHRHEDRHVIILDHGRIMILCYRHIIILYHITGT